MIKIIRISRNTFNYHVWVKYIGSDGEPSTIHINCSTYKTDEAIIKSVAFIDSIDIDNLNELRN